MKNININFIKLDDYAKENPSMVTFLHKSYPKFQYSYIPQNDAEKAVLHDGDYMFEYVACIKNVQCFAESDIIVMNDGNFYCEYKSIDRLRGVADCSDGKVLLKDDGSCQSINIFKRRANIKSGIFLSGIYSANYFHFTCGIVPKLLLSHFVPSNVPLLVDRNVRNIPSYRTLIDICNRENRELIFLDDETTVHVKELFIVSSPFFLAPNIIKGIVDLPVNTQYNIDVFNRYRALLMSGKDESFSCPRRIFLSRRKASARRPFNEYECIKLLRSYGFEVVYPEDYTLEQQIAMFNSAEFIVGGSGAAFTNILYCSPGCKVVIFIGYEIDMAYWQTLACMNDVTLHRITDRSKGRLTKDNHPYDLHSSFYVHPEDLEKLVGSYLTQKEGENMCEKEEEPLVTVSVLTHNSEKTVLETLESIKRQTYQKLVLQICDDCSQDRTMQLCNEWIDKNGDRFVDIKVFVFSENVGTSVNFNRSLDMCETTFLKDIAGDDVLCAECIEICVKEALLHKTGIYFGKVESFGGDNSVCDAVNRCFDYAFFDLSPKEQLEKLMKKNCIPAASAFYNVDIIRSLRLRNDERIRLLEDWPKWINYLKCGGVFGFIDKVIVKYRIGGVSNTSKNEDYIISHLKFNLLYRYVEVIKTQDTKIINGFIEEVVEQCGFIENDITIEEKRRSDILYLASKNKKHLKQLRVSIIANIVLLIIVFLFIAKMLF